MWQVYVYGFLAGLIGANGVPHFIKGIIGEKWLNFVVAGIFLYYSHYHAHLLRTFAMVAIGALVAGVVLSTFWANEPKRK
jgi:hypothetical protein